MKLLIVESPTKAKTIAKFLGSNFLIASSYGHVRDLPKSALGVDVKNDFKPKYVVPARAKKRVAELKKEAAKASQTILATDEDREGESIAWHLAYLLNLKNPQRIVFHEITERAIKEALKKPRGLDLNLVNAQQARRILDRLVGYKLSPFLWKKVMRGLSAGRVQSVAVRLVAEREREIERFKPDEYWSVEAELQKNGHPERFAQAKREESPGKEILRPACGGTQNDDVLSENMFKALLVKKNGETLNKLAIKNKKEAAGIVKELKGAKYQVEKIEKKEVKRNPLPPFTTSVLQQTAANRFGFSAKKIMLLAQRLYETGLITYHRTDSLNLSSQIQAEAKQFIASNFGKGYWPGYVRNYKTKAKSAQEAHEAIRPSYIQKTPDQLKAKLEAGQWKLYDLIWRRFLACQMSAAQFKAVKAEIEANNYTFRANGQTRLFDGFLKVYPLKFEEANLPQLEKNELLNLSKLIHQQHFTKPPARYSQAALIKKLEEEGIGRPSTYAPILETIEQRNYVQKDENKKLKPTEIGAMVNKLLVEHFPKIVDLTFTAQMEKELDEIAQGKDGWVKTLEDFFLPFEKNLAQKTEKVAKKDLTEKTDKICPQCGGEVIIRWGRFGKFYACSKFPNCKYTENLPKPSLGIACPKCQKGKIIEKKTKRGKPFYGCSQWPKCDFALWQKPVKDEKTGQVAKCPDCGSPLVKKNSQTIACSNKGCSFQKKDDRAANQRKN